MNIPSESILAEFIRYNNWANQQLLEACGKLSEEQLAQSMPGAYGTIRDTLRHIIEGEAFYILLLTRHRPRPPFKWEEKPSLAQMKDYAAHVGEALMQAINDVRPTDIIEEQDGGNKFRYQARAIFIQIINHGVEHRTNITTILSAAGQTAPGVDGWAYLTANPGQFDYQAG